MTFHIFIPKARFVTYIYSLRVGDRKSQHLSSTLRLSHSLLSKINQEALRGTRTRHVYLNVVIIDDSHTSHAHNTPETLHEIESLTRKIDPLLFNCEHIVKHLLLVVVVMLESLLLLYHIHTIIILLPNL